MPGALFAIGEQKRGAHRTHRTQKTERRVGAARVVFFVSVVLFVDFVFFVFLRLGLAVARNCTRGSRMKNRVFVGAVASAA